MRNVRAQWQNILYLACGMAMGDNDIGLPRDLDREILAALEDVRVASVRLDRVRHRLEWLLSERSR